MATLTMTDDEKDTVICEALVTPEGMKALLIAFLNTLIIGANSEFFQRDYESYIPKLAKFGEATGHDPRFVEFARHVITQMTIMVEEGRFEECKVMMSDAWLTAIAAYEQGELAAIG